MAYLNHAGTTWPKPAPVQAAVSAALVSEPTNWGEDYIAGRARVARAFGIPDPGRLLLTPGCTSALAVAVADHDWQPGDRVLCSQLEHHALVRPLEKLRDLGVEVVRLPRGADGPLDLEALRTELARGGVKLVALTGACNVTGELLPLGEILGLAREHGARTLVDGAQLAGWEDLDLPSLGVDLFAFAGHKALHGPWGIGGLYMAPHLDLRSPAAVCELPAPGAPPTCGNAPGPCDVGSVDRLALAGLVAALDWLAETPTEARLARARGRLEELTSHLERRPGVRILGTRDPLTRLPVVAFTHPERSPAELAESFREHGCTVGAGELCAPEAIAALGRPSGGVVRLSLGPMSSDRDVERALEAVSAL